MNDSANNLTLQQINYSQCHSTHTLESASVVYQSDYNWLDKTSLDRQEIWNIHLEPRQDKYSIKMYQTINHDQAVQHASQPNRKKIVTLTMNEDKNTLDNFRLPLPLTLQPLKLEIQTSKDGILKGTLAQRGGCNCSQLYDSDGIKKGLLHYQTNIHHAESIREISQQNPSFISQHTLNSTDFRQNIINQDSSESEQQSIAQPEIQQVKAIPQISVKLKKVKRITNRQQDLMEKQSKGEERREIMIEQRISSYRMPLRFDNPINLSKQIDFMALKRSKEQLGISSIDIEKMITPKYLRKITMKQSLQIPMIPITNISSPVQIPRQQTDLKRNILTQEMGIGTYTALPSRQFNDRTSIRSNYSIQSKSLKQSKARKENVKIQQYPKETLMPKINNLSVRKKVVEVQFEGAGKPEQSSYKQASQAESLSKILNSPIKSKSRVNKKRLYSNRVFEKTNKRAIQMSEVDRLSNVVEWESSSCKQSPYLNYNSPERSQSFELYPEINILISNISVNFHKMSFGIKYVELSIYPVTYKTEEINGISLTWIGQRFLFKQILSNDELHLSVKRVNEQSQTIIGVIKISVSDLILNKKQSYYQTFLLNKKQVLATVILGFQIQKKKLFMPKYPLQIERKSQAHSEITRSKTTKFNANLLGKKNLEQKEERFERMPSPKANPIKLKKYLGGRNIKIGRASRFQTEWDKVIPGPGDYDIQSSFNRHSYKQS